MVQSSEAFKVPRTFARFFVLSGGSRAPHMLYNLNILFFTNNYKHMKVIALKNKTNTTIKISSTTYPEGIFFISKKNKKNKK